MSAKSTTKPAAAAHPAVIVTRRFDAPPERVFDAWLDPAAAGRWLFATPQGTMLRVDIHARVGGKFVIVEQRAGEPVEHVGTYRELDRPRRIVFDFNVPKYSATSTRVTVEIAASGSGCELTLTHEGVLPDYRDRTVQGWTGILAHLAEILSRAGPPV